MAGHSKWANTKHRKARQDSVRQKMWGKLLKEITVAAKLGGGDAEANPRLRAAIAKSKSQSLPNKNIESAIKAGVGGNDGKDLDELIYEGYGVEGTAFIVTTLTDNKTRTVAEVRNIFSKYGGNMGESGAVAWGFQHVGQIILSKNFAEEELFEWVVEAGAEDLSSNDEVFEVVTPPDAFGSVLKVLEEKGIEPIQAELTYLPENRLSVSVEAEVTLNKMIEKFEDLDDVQEVYHNIEFSESEGEE